MICPICHHRWTAIRDESDPMNVEWTGSCDCGTARSKLLSKLVETHIEMVLEHAKKNGNNAAVSASNVEPVTGDEQVAEG